MEIKEIYKCYSRHSKLTTDTRKITKNAMFFALKGENFNANEFAEEALKKGASFVVIDDEEYNKNSSQYIVVDNVLETLQSLARYHREQLDVQIIALTGSNGKTTTKELVHAVLSRKYKTLATKGNLNNHIGVPLTLLSMSATTEIGIVEMGANHPGEIALLCEIAQPNFGYITNFGKAHLEGFGSIEGVIQAKSELYNYLKKSEGIAFVNTNDTIQMQRSATQKRYLMGKDVDLSNADAFVEISFNDISIQSNLIGKYNYSNISAAIGIGDYFKVSQASIKLGIESFIPENKRSQIISKGSTTIVLDAYNANPTSMQAALAAFKAHSAAKKIAVLGDMFELGASAEVEHQSIADLAESSGFDKVILIGENFVKVDSQTSLIFKEYKMFEDAFSKKEYENTSVLIKGSRGMELERIVDLFD